MRAAHRLAILALLPVMAPACLTAQVRTVVYYNFVQLEESAPDQHYQQFVDEHGGVVSFGCFVVQKRQTNCFDIGGNGQPNLHLGVVECTCPCVEEVPDPCDPAGPMVRAGTIRGVVDQVFGPVVSGGVEIPLDIDLSDATSLFITVEANDDTSPLPASDVLLRGKLAVDGAVIGGILDSPTTKPVTGRVTILPVQDEAPL
jgi:hypothetical protein